MSLFTSVVLCATLAEVQVESVSERCVDGAQFTIFTRRLNFEAAVNFCDQEGVTLARIGNEDEHVRVVDLVLSISPAIAEFWIGKA